MRIVEGTEQKTMCVTLYEAFKFLVIPFGLKNALLTFFTLMNQVFRSYLDKFAVVYLDGIVIFISTLKEHVQHIQLVFQKN